MNDNPLQAIRQYGQSIWLDDLRREMILSGQLRRLIETDGICGVTSNPAIFDKAIGESDAYDADIREMTLQNFSAAQIYEHLTVKDVQMAADLFRPLYEGSEGRHGYVSLEVNPHLARDVEATLAEARHLWQSLNRPNVMIKVPATRQGVICIQQLVIEGLNINVTLLFGLSRYRQVAEAYLGGLADRAATGAPLNHVASVASFFLSRIDVLVDAELKKKIEADDAGAAAARHSYGQTAIACAKGAYRIYREIFEGERFSELRRQGARPQQLLWASTSTKQPEFSDVKYVEALIGPDTINTLPQDTIDAYRDHGRPTPRLTQGIEAAPAVLNALAELDIDIDQVARELEDQGIEKFNQPYDRLMAKLEDVGPANQ